MYESFYGLRERPFNLTPDPKFLYLSEKHKEAFAHLLYGIKNRSGFVMITGEIGTGKTTLCRNLLNQLDSNTEVAFIFNPFLSAIELMKKINQEFGIESDADTVLELTEELNVHLLHSSAMGKDCVLVIDEAQNLSPQVLEQIRLLSNLETDTEKLLQIILIGQPELAEKLALRELRQLNQRITARYHLKSLSASETLQYIAYRIHVAGGRKRINFTKAAVTQVYKLAGGVPRMINALCDRTLLIGYTKEQHVISAKLVKQAEKEIRGEKIRAPKEPRTRWRRLIPSPALLLILAVAIVLIHYLVSPLDRFAQELNHFNRILTGSTEAVPGTPESGAARTAAEAASDATSPAVPVQPATEEPLRQVLNRLNAAGAGKNAQQLAPVLAELDAEKALQGGLETLLSLWNRPSPSEYPAKGDADTLVRFLEAQGLASEHIRPSAEHLAAINLPGLVRLHAGEITCWLGLVRMDQETVTLLPAVNKRIIVPLKEFSLYYAKEAVFSWNDAGFSGPVLVLGQKGPQIEALKEKLRRAGLLDAGNTGDTFDKATEKAVMRIQELAGLKADGKAGRQVRLALASFSADVPTLQERPAAGNAAESEGGAPADAAAITAAETVSKVPAPAKQDPLKKAVVAEKTAPVRKPSGETPAQKTAAPAAEKEIIFTAAEPSAASESNTDSSLSEERDAAAPGQESSLLRLLGAPADGVREEEEKVSAPSVLSVGGEKLIEERELPEPGVPFIAPGYAPEGLPSSATMPVTGSSPLVPAARESAYQ